MLRLDLYIGKTVFLACLAVILVVVGLDTLFGLINQLEDLSDQFPLGLVLEYTALTVPRRLYEFIGMSTLVGCLVGLGVLANSSELTVMRAAGVSKLRILRSVMQPVLLLVVLGVWLGEYVAPQAEQQAQALRATATGAQNGLTRHGVWHREGRWFMRFQAVHSDGALLGLTLYHFDPSGQLSQSRYAQRAVYQAGGWLLEDVQETRFVEQAGLAAEPQLATQTQHYERVAWDTSLRPQLLHVLAMEPDLLSLRDLYAYTRYLEGEGIDAGAYELAFWVKVLQPLAMLALVLVGISFVFGPLRSVTMGQRILAGVLVGLVFKFSQDLLGPASLVFGFSPAVSALVPVLVCFLIGGWLLRRGR